MGEDVGGRFCFYCSVLAQPPEGSLPRLCVTVLPASTEAPAWMMRARPRMLPACAPLASQATSVRS